MRRRELPKLLKGESGDYKGSCRGGGMMKKIEKSHQHNYCEYQAIFIRSIVMN